MRSWTFIAVLIVLSYIISVAAYLAMAGKYNEAINSLCGVAVGGLIGYMAPRPPATPLRKINREGE